MDAQPRLPRIDHLVQKCLDYRQAERRCAAGIRPRRNRRHLLRLARHLFEFDGHRAVGDRLTKEVVGPHGPLNGFPRLVITSIEGDLRLQLRQHILLDLHGRAVGGTAHLALNLVGPLQDLFGERAFGRRNPIRASLSLATEDDVRLRVRDREHGLLCAYRLQIVQPQSQAAYPNNLAGLV